MKKNLLTDMNSKTTFSTFNVFNAFSSSIGVGKSDSLSALVVNQWARRYSTALGALHASPLAADLVSCCAIFWAGGRAAHVVFVRS